MLSEHASDLTTRPPLEVWGGVECTVNRIGDQFFDQMARSRHMLHLDDIDRIADLGVRALRFPVLWEHVQSERDAEPNWRWHDRALGRLRERGVRPIVGLLHHGFGPRWVNALDPCFPEQLAAYARMVAERYPWVDAYTPVNEPLTTARFSGLYGHWHPHARDDATFARLLLAELTASARAMEAIRRVNSGAQFVQTEDLGKVASSPGLAHQRDFENERRWLTWDILTGKLSPQLSSWWYMRSIGNDDERTAMLADAQCIPDIIGINHYPTSERYLDERVDRYALDEIGGNGEHVYADVSHMHYGLPGRAGIGGLIREASERYHLPIAVTECHLGCTREEQMRWLHEEWNTCVQAHREGIDIRALTSWALLGSFDWNSLVTRASEYYEPGAFDVRGPVPRPTALATMIRALARDGRFDHPVLATQGWWHRRVSARVSGRPILIVDEAGAVDRELLTALDIRGLAFLLIDREERDIDSRPDVERLLDAHHPWAVIDASRYADALADECARRGLLLVRYAAQEQDVNDFLDTLIDDECRLAEVQEPASAAA